LQLEAERDAALTSLKAAEEKIALNRFRLDSLLQEHNEKDELVASLKRQLEETSTRDETANLHEEEDVTLTADCDEVAALKTEIEAITSESEETINQWRGKRERQQRQLENYTTNYWISKNSNRSR
jgi:hypothetical protein